MIRLMEMVKYRHIRPYTKIEMRRITDDYLRNNKYKEVMPDFLKDKDDVLTKLQKIDQLEFLSDDELAKLIFYGDDSAGNSDGFASISVHATAGTSGSESSKITFNNCSGGTFANSFVLDGDSKISLSNKDSGTSNTVFGK